MAKYKYIWIKSCYGKEWIEGCAFTLHEALPARAECLTDQVGKILYSPAERYIPSGYKILFGKMTANSMEVEWYKDLNSLMEVHFLDMV